jgi:hypothetical protein
MHCFLLISFLATFWFTGILSFSVIDSLFLLLNMDAMGFKQHDILNEYCLRRIGMAFNFSPMIDI